MLIDHKLLLECLSYDRDTGVFLWLFRPACHFSNERVAASWNAKHAGKAAGTLRKDGYLSVKLYGREYLLHRLAWFYEHARWPHPVADHIDRDRANNKMSNLREVSYRANAWNCSSARGSSSQYLGVSWNKDIKKWTAQIGFLGKVKRIGVFMTEPEAAAAYATAKLSFHRGCEV